MSNIINNKNDLLKLKDFINIFSNNELSKDNIEEFFKELLPSNNGKLLINYKVNEKGITTAEFIPYTKSINISLNKINEWLDNNTYSFSKNLKSNDANILRVYLFILIITHEIEHSYQYLMGEDIVESPNNVLKNAYKGIFDILIPKNYIIPRPISNMRRFISIYLYKLNQNFYLLERNANIESMDLVSKCALFNNREDISTLFSNMKKTYSRCGYINSCIGSIEETYKKILMYDKYKKFYQDINLTEKDQIRYGFRISEETRNKILSNKKSN